MSVARTRSLPFKWNEFFIPSETECLLACFAMSARYWGSYFPDLGLPNDLEVWKEFAEKSFIEYRGTYISEMLQKMPKIDKDTSTISPEEASELEGISSETTQFSELVIKVNTPKDLNSLVPFFQTRPPIPQILSFNQLLMTHNVNGPNHAVILHQIDFEKEKLFVIDPTKHQLHEPDACMQRREWKWLTNTSRGLGENQRNLL